MNGNKAMHNKMMARCESHLAVLKIISKKLQDYRGKHDYFEFPRVAEQSNDTTVNEMKFAVKHISSTPENQPIKLHDVIHYKVQLPDGIVEQQ